MSFFSDFWKYVDYPEEVERSGWGYSDIGIKHTTASLRTKQDNDYYGFLIEMWSDIPNDHTELAEPLKDRFLELIHEWLGYSVDEWITPLNGEPYYVPPMPSTDNNLNQTWTFSVEDDSGFVIWSRSGELDDL